MLYLIDTYNILERKILKKLNSSNLRLRVITEPPLYNI